MNTVIINRYLPESHHKARKSCRFEPVLVWYLVEYTNHDTKVDHNVLPTPASQETVLDQEPIFVCFQTVQKVCPSNLVSLQYHRPYYCENCSNILRRPVIAKNHQQFYS